MNKQGLRTTIYSVFNLEKARAWYEEAFQTKAYFVEPFYVGFDIAGYELGLIPEKKEIKNKSENVCTYWGVDKVNEEFNRLLSLGATSFEQPHNVGGELIVAAVKDPWENVIGLIYNPDFKPLNLS